MRITITPFIRLISHLLQIDRLTLFLIKFLFFFLLDKYYYWSIIHFWLFASLLQKAYSLLNTEHQRIMNVSTRKDEKSQWLPFVFFHSFVCLFVQLRIRWIGLNRVKSAQFRLWPSRSRACFAWRGSTTGISRGLSRPFSVATSLI